VVNHFKDKGVVFVNDLDEVPEGSWLLFSAHGISPQTRAQSERRKLRTIDATCPLVTKVHREAVRFARDGYKILLIGHAGHDEVIGTMGEAPEAFRLVQTIDDAATIEVEKTERLAYLTQTTLSVTESADIIAKLKERFPHIVGPKKEDICYATQNRQEAVRTLSGHADMLLVVGSHNSSNSRRLAELGPAHNVPSHLIDGPDDIDLGWFQGDETLLITAGASAPESVVQECVELLRWRFGGSVELQAVREEQVRFALPVALETTK
jgi:4-hydroxy-3-methylbut-2-enyl diphosphate reductase